MYTCFTCFMMHANAVLGIPLLLGISTAIKMKQVISCYCITN